MRFKMLTVTLVAGLSLTLAGCEEQAPASKPPEARATPRLVENPPEPVEHGPSDGHNHGPSASPGPLDATNHGYSKDGTGK